MTLPSAITEESLAAFKRQLEGWVKLKVELHVFDFRATAKISDGFIAAVSDFVRKLKFSKGQLVSLNVPTPLLKQIQAAGADSVFNCVRSLGQGIGAQRMQSLPVEKRTLILKYLAEGVFKAVQVALSSTVSCDENYGANPSEVSLDKFDVISVMESRNQFLRADFRLLVSLNVLDKLCRAMHGPGAEIDLELLESMSADMMNMIYGHAKSQLNEKEGFNLPSGIPKLIRKIDFVKVTRSKPPNILIMPAVTPMGSFFIEVDFLS